MACIVACPFGNMLWDDAYSCVQKCDLCGGEPRCVPFCPTGALQIVEREAEEFDEEAVASIGALAIDPSNGPALNNLAHILADLGDYDKAEAAARKALDDAIAEALDGPELIYLSVDIDVLDPGMAPGTGTPEPGGLLSRELLDTVRRLARELPVVGADVVEVAPPYDGPGQVTAFLANRVVLEILNGMAERKTDTQ